MLYRHYKKRVTGKACGLTPPGRLPAATPGSLRAGGKQKILTRRWIKNRMIGVNVVWFPKVRSELQRAVGKANIPVDTGHCGLVAGGGRWSSNRSG